MPGDDFQVSPETGFTFATAFLTIVQNALQGVPVGTEDLFVGDVANQPTTIFDLNGSQLFYDFPIMLNSQILGTIRVAATKLIGTPWIAIQQALPFDEVNALNRASMLVAAQMPGSEVLESKPVCHLYPSVGLLIKIKLASGDEAIRIFDPENMNGVLIEIPEGAVETEQDRSEGAYTFSLLASLPEGSDPAEDFNRFDQLLNAIVSEAQDNHPEEARVAKENLIPRQLKDLLLWNAKNQPERSAPLPEGQNMEKILPVTQIPQEGDVFCVIACILMIRNFLGAVPLPTQSDVAQQLQEPPSLFIPESGILPSSQIDAFRRILPANCQVTFDGTPTWQEFVNEIEAGRPFKSGITGHARVAIGYQITQIGPVATSPPILSRSLWINDPSKSAGMMLETHEVAELDPADLSHITSIKPRIPFKTNSVLVQRLES